MRIAQKPISMPIFATTKRRLAFGNSVKFGVRIMFTEINKISRVKLRKN